MRKAGMASPSALKCYKKACNRGAYFSTAVLGESFCRTDYQIIKNIIANEFPLSHDILSD